MWYATPSIVQIEKPIEFVEEDLTNEISIVEDTSIVLNIPNSIPSSSGSNKGMEKGGISISIPEPTDPRPLLGHGFILEVEIGELSPVVCLRLNQTRAKWVRS